jgi:hypothetical protein
MWGGGGDEDVVDGMGDGLDEYDVVVIRPRKNSLPNWLNKMEPEDRKQLFETIGYTQNSSFENDPSVSASYDAHI